MKRFAFLFVILLAAPLYAFDDPDTPPVDSKIRAGLAACNNFAANFKSQSENDDKNTFQDRFGLPRDINYSTSINEGSSTEYNYDAYTKITLDCQSDTCRAHCDSKF